MLVELESNYATIMLFGGLGTIISRCVHHYFYGMHRPKVVLVSALCGNATNIFLNYVLIFGNLGAPKLGLTGAGIATVIWRIRRVPDPDGAVPEPTLCDPIRHAQSVAR